MGVDTFSHGWRGMYVMSTEPTLPPKTVEQMKGKALEVGFLEKDIIAVESKCARKEFLNNEKLQQERTPTSCCKADPINHSV
jgi:hypothetical protein